MNYVNSVQDESTMQNVPHDRENVSTVSDVSDSENESLEEQHNSVLFDGPENLPKVSTFIIN